MVNNMNIQEYEELFGKYKSEHKEQLISCDDIVSYATKEECEKLNNKHTRKKLEIPKKCKICTNCKYLYEHWYECDCYDTYCTHSDRQRRRDLSYCSTREKGSCDKWEWNAWQLVNPDTWTTLCATDYIGYIGLDKLYGI